MLRSLKDLERYGLTATDGNVGSVVDFLLDDERWVVRYLVVDTGNWLGGRRVLISPISFREAEWSTRRFHLALTMAKIKSAPNVDVDLPVSRQHERDFHSYYGYPYYWGLSAGYWGMGSYTGLLATGGSNQQPVEHSEEPPGDGHLRSAREVRGYYIQGSDDSIGHVQDFIVDDETWEVRYLVIDTSNWWSGKKVLVAPHWASRVSWAERKVYVDLSREVIKSSPEWKENEGVNRDYEVRLYDYYGRPAYWGSSDHPETATSPRQPGRHIGRT